MTNFGLQMPHFASRNTQHLLKTTSNSSLFPQNPCTIQINALSLQQHTYPASRKNSALRVSFFFMDMTLKYYNQPHITVEEQIQLLKSEGLSFENESRAKHLLNHISMFRLKCNLKPFRQHNSRCFKSGATVKVSKLSNCYSNT